MFVMIWFTTAVPSEHHMTFCLIDRKILKMVVFTGAWVSQIHTHIETLHWFQCNRKHVSDVNNPHFFPITADRRDFQRNTPLNKMSSVVHFQLWLFFLVSSKGHVHGCVSLNNNTRWWRRSKQLNGSKGMNDTILWKGNYIVFKYLTYLNKNNWFVWSPSGDIGKKQKLKYGHKLMKRK